MVTKVDTAIKLCTDLCRSYRVERNRTPDNSDEFTLRFDIERAPGATIPVTFEHLNRSDLLSNGFEVPL